MKDYLGEIIITLAGIITTYAAWQMGGKQSAKNDSNTSITSGTDKMISTLEKLIEIANEGIKRESERAKAEMERAEAERERAQVERDHRESCEKSLNDQKKMIERLNRKVLELEKKVK